MKHTRYHSTHWSLLGLLLLDLSCAARTSEQSGLPETGRLRVAVCQLEVSGDRASALAAVEHALEQAARGQADLACFPEACLFGWVNPDAHRLADPIPGKTTERLGVLARRFGLMIAIGLAERDGERLFNSVVLIDRDGRLLLKHRKLNILSELMVPPYTPGSDASRSVVDTRFGRIGLLICADTFKPEIVQTLADRKPDLVLVPYGWAAPEEQWPDHGRSLHAWIRNTALKVNAPVVGVDASGRVLHGPWTGYLYGGQSTVADRNGQLQGILADRAPEVRLFELSIEQPAAAGPFHP